MDGLADVLAGGSAYGLADVLLNGLTEGLVDAGGLFTCLKRRGHSYLYGDESKVLLLIRHMPLFFSCCRLWKGS